MYGIFNLMCAIRKKNFDKIMLGDVKSQNLKKRKSLGYPEERNISQEKLNASWQNNSFIIRTLPSVKEFHLFGIKIHIFENNYLHLVRIIFLQDSLIAVFLLPKA